MRPAFFRSYGILGLIIVPLALAAAVFGAPAPATAPQSAAAPRSQAIQPTLAIIARATQPALTLTIARWSTPTRLPATDVPTEAAARDVATPPAASTPFRIGIQAGHWRAGELPAELTHLHISSGAFAAGHSEAAITLDIARRVATLLTSIGVAVDVLPAAIPPGYAADAFVALHADGSEQGSVRGFKLAAPWAASRAGQHLLDTLTAEYERATGLPHNGAITADMRGYYAFNYRRYAHAIAKTTPAVIVEMGFLTNSNDRTLLVTQPDVVAIGIANGIIRYLNEHDSNDHAALLPPDFGVWRGMAAGGIDVRAAPHEDAKILLHIEAERPVIPFEDRDGWFRVVVVGAWDVVGWMRKDTLVRVAGT